MRIASHKSFETAVKTIFSSFLNSGDANFKANPSFETAAKTIFSSFLNSSDAM